ncbi:hypothetical protein [Pontibacter flavimaris]|uniref:Uncharacterized protein n=1 Tax=Pontibacter flavimaris TaxID=1797110 RepID=A0A1Q5PDR4_9BACT|nr:hypothetical protein [Pontibacter flavimaris]OKL40323.1 hypothetical protein A3841_18550 [Pontibacter flavimaris]
MNFDYRNDRSAFGQREEGSFGESGSMSAASGKPHYGRDNASMRGNDYYGTQGYNNDYSRGNYSASTYGSVRSGKGGYTASQSGSMDRNYIEFPDYSNRPTYGSYAGSRAYTDFIDHNYGYTKSGLGSGRYSSSTYSTRDDKKLRSTYDHKQDAPASRAPFRSSNQSRYSENDGRRR